MTEPLHSEVSLAGVPRRQRHRRGVRRWAWQALLVLTLVATFSAGVGADRLGVFGGTPADASSSITDQPQFQSLQETWDLIHGTYVDQSAVVDSDLLYGAAKGMVDALGDTGHSTFLDPSEAQAFEQETSGQLIGIGVEIDFQDGLPRVIAPIDGSPAAAAGVKPRDLITAVNGQSTAGLTVSDLFKLLRGDEGTAVDVTFQRPSTGESFTAHLVRAKIAIVPVSWTMLPNQVALVRLSEFSAGAGDQIVQALRDAKAQGAAALILDLRNNPGGLVSEAISVANQFLPEGTPIYQVRDKNGDSSMVKTTGTGEWRDLPMVVLVNSGSASSAEIVASGLQESGRATLIGETTYGTGTVLSPTVLDDGSVVLLGTALWLTASGKQIWHVGIVPTTKVDLPADVDPYRPQAGETLTNATLTATGDTQLLAGFDAVSKLIGR